MSVLQMSGQKRLSVVLLLATGALAALLAYEWQQGMALRESVLALKSHHAATPPELKLEPPFQLQPLPSYARITDQPLFVASRKPAQQASAPVAPPTQFELTGIAQTPKEAVVLLRNAKTGQTERLKSDQKSADLQLESVKPDGATIKQNGQKVELDLHVVLSGGRPNLAADKAPTPTAAQAAAPGSPPRAASSPAGEPQRSAAPATVEQKGKSTKSAVDSGLEQLNQQRAKMGLPPLQ